MVAIRSSFGRSRRRSGGHKRFDFAHLWLGLLLVAACSGSPLEGTGVACDPMAYSLDDEVWVLQGGRTIRLNEEGLLGANPAISADGERVAFTSGRTEAGFDLFTVNVDGSNRNLVYAGDLTQSSVDWSPDDSLLVFDQWSDELPLQIFTISADGSGDPLQLTDGEPNGKPKWGPTGSILFLSLRDGENQEIYSMQPDGSSPVNLTSEPTRDVLAEMSPDGSSIVFASTRSDGDHFGIWLMNADGSDPRRLTNGVERETNPNWSSDGAHIIYRSDEAPVGLWYMNRDGTGQKPLLSEAWLASCP